ncbi:MAG: hypothetical protein ACREN2_12205 [Candidatus Dormibacteria bacterium]
MQRRLWYVLACALVFTTALTVASATARASTGWTKVATSAGYLYDVTCVSTGDCWSVGALLGSNAPSTDRPLIEHYDGSSWSVYPSPALSVHSALTGIACTAANDCWAVGESVPTISEDLIEHFDGSSWTQVPGGLPLPGGGLAGVTCTSPTNCWATGFQNNAIEHYDGTQWTIAFAPASPVFSLYRVRCVGSSNCWAVGRTLAVPSTGLIAHYDGTQWAFVAAAQPANDAGLDDVACPTAGDCWAVGCASTCANAAAQNYNGTTWSDAPIPSIQASDELTGVVCAGPSACWAAGGFGSSGPGVMANWDGQTWSVSAVGFSAYAVTCFASGECWAAGADLGHLAAATSPPTPPPTAAPTPSPSPTTPTVPSSGVGTGSAQLAAGISVLSGLALTVGGVALRRRRHSIDRSG